MPFCFLNIYKPCGITSFDVIYKLRKHLKLKKIGHSGTLDPMAEGVMQVAAGNASRLLEYLNSDKEYIADIKFGFSSTTLDAEGEIKKAADPHFTKQELEGVLKSFIGKISQIPPKFSAIKVCGKKLCDLARKNPDAEIEIPERKIQIYKCELIELSSDTAKIKMACSKGAYIRTLAQDIAKRLGTDAYLTGLIRTRAGNFKIENSVKIEYVELERDALNPMNVLELQKYKLNETEFARIKNGASIKPKAPVYEPAEPIMLIFNKNLVSIGVLSDNVIRVAKVF